MVSSHLTFAFKSEGRGEHLDVAQGQDCLHRLDSSATDAEAKSLEAIHD